MNWLKYLEQQLGDDEIEEVEVKIEYADGSKKKWTFAEGQDPVLEDGEEEEEDDSEEDVSEEDDSEEDDSEEGEDEDEDEDN